MATWEAMECAAVAGSGAVGEFLYDLTVPVEPASWGAIKTLHR